MLRRLLAAFAAVVLFCSPALAQEYSKMVNGVKVPMTQAEIEERQLEESKPPAPKPLNVELEEAFLSMLPKHLGKPYLTKKVVREVLEAKQAITDANRLGLFSLSKAIIQDLTLPTEMEADRQSLLQLFP